MTLTPLSNTLVNLTVTSLNGFQGTVYLDTDSAPGGGLFVWWVHTGRAVYLLPGQRANATILINTPSNPGLLFQGERVIWVSASAYPCLNHVVTIPITVLPLPTYDFTITATPANLTFPAGDSLRNSTITVSSINGFNGTIAFQWIGGLGSILNPLNFTLHPGGVEAAQLIFYPPTTSCVGIYSVPVIASGGSIQHSVVVMVRLTDPTVSTIYFWPSGFCCRPVNYTFTVYVNVNIPSGQAINAVDVRVNYTNPWSQLSQGVARAENLSYSGGLFQQAVVLVECIDGHTQIKAVGCSPDDSPAPGQIHLSMNLPGSEIAGPVDGTLFSFSFKVMGNGTSTFTFDRALLVNPRPDRTIPGLLDPEYIPVVERMAAFSNPGAVAIFDSWPSLPSGSPALRQNQPVIFSAAGSFSADNPYLPIQSYSWSFGDGTKTNTTIGVIDHTYNSPGSYIVSLKVVDGGGETGELVREIIVSRPLGNLTLTVRDQSGTIQPGNVRVVLYNASFQTTPVAVQNTDMSGQASFYNLTPGTYNATLTGSTIVTESTNETILPGWTTQDTVYVPISSSPSVTVTSVNPNPANTGALVDLTFTVTSPATLLGISVDWGDGTITHPSPTATSDTHSYPRIDYFASRIFTINVTATNSAGQAFATISETVNDRATALTITNLFPDPANTGQPVTLNFAASDPDGIVQATWVDWGDGSVRDLIFNETSGSMCQRLNPNMHTDSCTLAIGDLLFSQPENPATIVNGSIIIFRPYPAEPTYLVAHRVIKIIPATESIYNQITFWTEGDANAVPDAWNQANAGIPAGQVVTVYKNTLPSPESPSSRYDTHTYSTVGSYTIIITAADNSGSASHVTSSPLNVSSPLSPPSAATQAPTILGLARIELYALVGLILIVITAAVLLSFREKKGSDTPDSKPS